MIWGSLHAALTRGRAPPSARAAGTLRSRPSWWSCGRRSRRSAAGARWPGPPCLSSSSYCSGFTRVAFSKPTSLAWPPAYRLHFTILMAASQNHIGQLNTSCCLLFGARQEVHAVGDRALVRRGAHHLLHAGAQLLHAAQQRRPARLQVCGTYPSALSHATLATQPFLLSEPSCITEPGTTKVGSIWGEHVVSPRYGR